MNSQSAGTANSGMNDRTTHNDDSVLNTKSSMELSFMGD